jgi:hypothetical protein
MKSFGRIAILCCIAGTLLARAAAAQTCIGLPAADHGWVMGAYGRESSPDAATLGAEAGWRITPQVSLMAGAERSDLDGATYNRQALEGGIAYSVAAGARTAVCLTSRVLHEDFGDVSVTSVPIGIAAGWTTALGAGRTSLSVHVEPSYAFERATIAGFARNSGAFAGRAGISLSVRSFVAAVAYEHGFSDDGASKTLARLGLVF